ncbi:MAG: tail fiber protein, partial [Gammaproteobacteria bacterium]
MATITETGIKFPDGTTQTSISDSVSSTSTDTSASSKAVKTAYDKANHSHPYAASSHTHPYLPSAGGTITGSLHLDNNAGLTSTTSGETLRVLFPGGGAMKNAGATETGSIKITLPVGMTNGMLTCKVSVYEYATNESFEVVFGGYNYPGGNTWAHNAFGYIVGSPLATQDYAIR